MLGHQQHGRRSTQGLVCPTKACGGIVVQSAAEDAPAQPCPPKADPTAADAQPALEGTSEQTQRDTAASQASAVPNGEHHADGAQANGEPDDDPQPSIDADPQKPPSTVWRCLQCETAMPAQGPNNSGCEQQACERTRPLCVTCLRCRECSPFAWQCFAMRIAKHVDGPQLLQQPIKPPPYGVLWSRLHVYSLRRK